MMDMEISTGGELGPIFAALSKAQGDIKGAVKDSTNPHFKSRYADLESTWEACRVQLTKNGLAVVQSPFSEGENIGVVTILGHTSGAWIMGRLVVKPMKFDAQGAGSVITYLRRYALAAMAGVAPTDDDGEAAVGRPADRPQRVATPIPPAAQGGAVPQTAASPAPSADEKARERFSFLQREIKATKSNDALDAVMSAAGWPPGSNAPAEGSDLAAIYTASLEAGQKIVGLMVKRRADLTADTKKALGDEAIPF
jgi:ERF superfamily